ncbi:MAG: hypothetical protein JXQ30_04805 [Spirochaetes bacterium]|nr:hypothetical protein [Spirochaetota bacterium]
MRYLGVLLILVFFPSAPALCAGRETPKLYGALQAEAGLRYRTNEDRYLFDLPLYGSLGVEYAAGILESKISVDYADEAGLGETYIKGGTTYSYLKIGNFSDRWGNGYSISPVSILNGRDGRYPENVFHLTRYRPNPMFTMGVGSKLIHGEFAVSGREGVPASIYDAFLGTRISGMWEGYDMSLGFVRRAGIPPSLFFLTAGTKEPDYSVWSEIGWVSNAFGDDLGSLVVGYRREAAMASVTAEYALWGANSLMLIENMLHLQPGLDAGAKLFLHFSDFRDAWSAATNLYFRLGIEKEAFLEPGIILFFGKPGTYLGPYEEDNNNGIYLRFLFSF